MVLIQDQDEDKDGDGDKGDEDDGDAAARARGEQAGMTEAAREARCAFRGMMSAERGDEKR